MNDNNHTIYYNEKGEVVPSVTTVLKVFGKNLIGWANWLGFMKIKVDDYLQERASLGTYIHSVAEDFFNDKVSKYADINFLGQPDYDLLLGKLEYMKDILKEKGYEKYDTEIEMHGSTYGGTADIVFYNKEKDKYLLLDYKTSKSTYRSMFIQLAAYCKLLKETKGISIDTVGIVLIMKDQYSNEFINLKSVEDNKDNGEIFNSLLNIYYKLDDNDKKSL